MAIIRTSNLSKIYNQFNKNQKIALSNISLTIENGSFVCIMGPSGSGKTTLLNILSTIDTPTSGNIYIFEKNAFIMNDNEKATLRKENFGFVFQDKNLIDSLTNRENIFFALNLLKKKQTTNFQQLTKNLNIDDILDKYPFECSGGQQQRVAIARALIKNPTILFADEPTGNLDSTNAKQLMEYLTKINKEYGITIVMVTHDCFVSSYSYEMYYVKDGKITNHIFKNNDSFEKYYAKVAKISLNIDL